jgi:hypothetical protein
MGEVMALSTVSNASSLMAQYSVYSLALSRPKPADGANSAATDSPQSAITGFAAEVKAIDELIAAAAKAAVHYIVAGATRESYAAEVYEFVHGVPLRVA